MDQAKDAFPGHDDAGKAIEWISRQIFSTSLGKDLQSMLAGVNDVPMSHQKAPYLPATP